MKQQFHSQTKNREKIVQATCLFRLFLVVIWLGGCSIWDANLHPNYESSRADRLCHPYGECSQGTWVAADGASPDVDEVKMACHDVVSHRYGNGEWEEPVAKGLEIRRCMEKKGYKLQQ